MYVPEFKGPIEGYVVNQLSREHWKVEKTMPWDDVMQEAYCTFLHCRRKYAGKVTEPKHFMALFKRAWLNRFIDLANEDTRLRAECALPADINGVEFEREGETDNDGALAVMIRQAPREIQMVLSLFLNAPQELLDLALSSWRAQGDKRMKAGGSEKVNRLLGLPEDRDTMKDVFDYFSK